jgi:hypothetical protein
MGLVSLISIRRAALAGQSDIDVGEMAEWRWARLQGISVLCLSYLSIEC